VATDSPQFRYRDPAPGFFHGLRAAFSGVGLSLRRGPVRTLYFRLMVVVTLVCVAFQAAGVWAVLTYWSAAADASTLSTIGHVIAEVVAIILVLLAAPLLALLLVSIALPVLAESLFLAALDTRRPELADALRSGDGLGIATSVSNNVRRMVRLLVGTAFSFALTLIPVAGAILGPATQLYVTARALSWELLDPWFDLNRMKYADQKEFVDRHRGLCLGFGVPYSLLMAVPVIGPMTFGIAQSGAALLVSDALLAAEK
jgi:CysZ protein